MRIRNEESEILVVHRPNPQQLPNVALPFYPRSVGHFKIRGREREFVPAGEKPFVQLFWTVRGEGRCRIAGETVPVRPGDVFYHLPITETISRQQNGVISCIRSPKRMNRSCGQLPDGVQCGENP